MSASNHDSQCPECRGEGRGREEVWNWNGDTIAHRSWECEHCDGTGIDPEDSEQPAGSVTLAFIAQVGRKFALVWADDETAEFERDRRIKPGNWYQVHDACVSVYGLIPKPYGVPF